VLGTWEGVVECGLAPDNGMRLFEAPGFKIRDEVLQAQRMIPSESQVIEMFSTFNEGWALEYTVGQGTDLLIRTECDVLCMLESCDSWY